MSHKPLGCPIVHESTFGNVIGVFFVHELSEQKGKCKTLLQKHIKKFLRLNLKRKKWGF